MGSILFLILKIYLLAFSLCGFILSLLLNNDKFYNQFIKDQKKLMESSFDEETKQMANMINFNIEDYVGLLVFEAALNPIYCMIYIVKLLFKNN